MQRLNVILFQPNPKTGDFLGNLKTLGELYESVSGDCDLAVVPIGSVEGGGSASALKRADARDALCRALKRVPEFVGAPRILLYCSDGEKPVGFLYENGEMKAFSESTLAFEGWEFALKENARGSLFISADRYSAAHSRFSLHTGRPLLRAGIAGGQDRFIFAGDTGYACGREEIFLPFWTKGAVVFTLLKEEDETVSVIEKVRTKDEFPPVCADWRYEALRAALRDYVEKSGVKGIVLGLSGGIDSALSATLARDALGSGRVRVIRLPSQYTSDLSNGSALELARRQGLELSTLPIGEACIAFKRTLSPLFEGMPSDVTEENIQARVRGTLLMAVANKFNLLLLCNGNKAEAAMGYSTLYGDQTGGFAPLLDLWKSDVTALCIARNANPEDPDVIPTEIIEREPSAELREDQKDSDSLPPYEDIERVLTHFLRGGAPEEAGVDPETAKRIVSMTLRSNFKRAQSVPGPVLTDIPLSLLNDWGFNTRYEL